MENSCFSQTSTQICSPHNILGITNQKKPLFLALAKQKQQESDYDGALQLYSQQIRIHPSSAISYYGMGSCYVRMGLNQLAIKSYQKAILLDPMCKFAYNGLGIAYQIEEDYAKARSCFHKCIEIDPNFYYPYNSMGNLLYFARQYSSALPYYKKAVQLQQNNSLLHANLACCLLMLGHYEQAFSSFVESSKQYASNHQDLQPSNKQYIGRKLQEFRMNVSEINEVCRERFIDILNSQMESRYSNSTIDTNDQLEQERSISLVPEARVISA